MISANCIGKCNFTRAVSVSSMYDLLLADLVLMGMCILHFGTEMSFLRAKL